MDVLVTFKPLSHGPKNVGEIRVESGFDPDNTFHMRESTPDTVKSCYRPRVESGLKMADKGVMR